MNVYFDWIAVFQIFCIVQGITTGIYLLLTKYKQPSQRWLGLLILGMTLQVVDYFLSRTGVYYRNRWLYFSPLFYSLSFGPLFYCYIKSLIQKSYRVSFWHFVPVSCQLLFYLILVFQPLPVKADFWIFIHKPYTRYLEYYGASLSIICYLLLSLHLMRTLKKEPRFLYYFFSGLTFFYIIAAIDPIINHYYLSPQAPKFYLSSQVLPIFMYALALISVFKKPVDFTSRKSLPKDVDKGKIALIIKEMQQNKWYKNPDLSLPLFAQHLGLHSNEVSKLINEGLNKTFNDLVNEFRLAEVKERLLKGEDQQFTLFGIALEAGFNSKTTFNRVFKEQTGMPPKAYKKSTQIIKRNDTAISGS